MRAATVAIVLLGLVAFAAASCPNQCSGHGRCGANDKCECYEQTNTPWGQRSGYTGADCSRRTCPLGTAFAAIAHLDARISTIVFEPVTAGVSTGDQLNVFFDSNYLLDRDETIIIRTSASGVADAASFQWKFESDPFFQQPVEIISGAIGTGVGHDEATAYELPDHTNSDGPTGIRVWFDVASGALILNDQWTFDVKHNEGTRFVATNDNTLHQQVQCSGRGSCDAETGRCGCFVGYSGEACQRTTCPNACSGHGVCQELRRFADDAGKSYDDTTTGFLGPYDARKQMGCLCDLGFRGPDCSLIECPSGADPLGADGGAEGRDCSGRGVCDYSTGQCACFKGYYGERCETQTNFI